MATVHGVVNSQTQPKQLSTHTHMLNTTEDPRAGPIRSLLSNMAATSSTWQFKFTVTHENYIKLTISSN